MFSPLGRPGITLQSVKLKKSEFDLERGLLRSELLPWVPTSVDSTPAQEFIRTEAPADGTEIVEWMHYGAADNAVFDAMCEEYNRLGSQLLSGSGDGYIPGVRVGDLRAVSVRGSTVIGRGYGEISTPRGTFRVPRGGKSTFCMRDILAWGALSWAGSVQWVPTLLQWRGLARAPIDSRVRFPGSRNLVAPNFISVATRIPAPMATMRIGLTSNRPQNVVIRGRGTKGAFQDVLFEDSFDIEAGESEAIYNVFGFPFAPAFTLELQPKDGTSTILDYLDAFP